MRKILAIILLPLFLGACTTVNPFASVKNPVTAAKLYQAELAYDGALKTFNELKSWCTNRILPPKCRTYVQRGQDYIRQASAARVKAEKFIENNPTLDATSVVEVFSIIVANFGDNTKSLSALKQ